MDDPVILISARCKGCGLCFEVCQAHVFDFGDENPAPGDKPVVARPERCIHCGLCQMLCPDFAIVFKDDKPKEGGMS